MKKLSAGKCLILGAGALSFFLSPGVFAFSASQVHKDSLIYSNDEPMRAVWQPAMGEEFASLLERTGQGVRLTDLSGDCWQDINTQRAVFLRKPAFEGDYYFQVEIGEFVPEDRFAQAGLVLWADEDHYVRNTLGFCPPGLEGLGEFGGRPISKGVYRIFPRRHPQRCLLRLEVLNRTVRTYFSYDGKRWYCTGGFSLPRGTSTKELFKGIGLQGVAGKMVQAPLFSRWEEGPLTEYRDDDFSGEAIGSHWLLGQTNGGWGSDAARWEQQDGILWIHPFPGADVYFYQENYPFAAMAAPRAASWEIELKLAAFDPGAKGLWNKAGVILWNDSYHYLYLAAVADQEQDQMYCEALACGAERAEPSALFTEGFRERTKTDVFFRARRLSPHQYTLTASYDREHWMHLGAFSIALDEPQIRLFVSGDISVQYPRDYNFAAGFDFIRMGKMPLSPPSSGSQEE